MNRYGDLDPKKRPPELFERLKAEAKESRRSLNQEALARLERSLAVRQRSGEETVAALRRLHRKFTRLAPLTERFLARAKNQGRP